MIEIEGEIERITFASEQSGFTVARLRPRGGGEPVTLTGSFAALRAGTLIRVSGEWVEHPRFGRQLKVSEYRPILPATRDGIERYLGSGLVRGIGPVTARRIVERFGEETIQIIDTNPERLRAIPGIGKKKLEEIRVAWSEQRGIRDVMLFLQGNGLSTAHAARIFRRYGASSVELVRSDPYRLAEEIFGIGFTTADALAGRLGIQPDAPERCDAGVLHTVSLFTEEGSTAALQEEVVRRSAELLAVSSPLIETSVERLVTAGRLVADEVAPTVGAPTMPVLSLPALNAAEKKIAERVRVLLRVPSLRTPERIEKTTGLIAEREKRLGVTLAQEQREAAVAVMLDPLAVVTGGPGTGKTTLLRASLDILQAAGTRVLLAAPTGRAAKRLTEATGREAVTIHRLLAYDPSAGRFRHGATDPLSCDLLVVDEASMIDTPLMASLLDAVAPPTRLLLVGDADQLPSVGPGSVLRDLIASGRVPVVALTRVFRQSEESRIVTGAHAIIRGAPPDFANRDEGDLFFIEQADPERIRSLILSLVCDRIPKRFGFDPVDEIQVITPMNRGTLGTIALNELLQTALNPRGADANPQEAGAAPGGGRVKSAESAPKHGVGSLRIGDKVMQVRNDYEKELFNGDLGRVTAVDRQSQRLSVRFDSRQVDYAFQELDELQLAYAVSVHKSQGAEYPAVVIPLVTQHYAMLQRNLLYTAVTRGKRLVVIVGTRRALAIAVGNDRTQQRVTLLRVRLEKFDNPKKARYL